MREQPAARRAGQRSIGQVEAVKLRRRSRKHPELLLFKGEPASGLSIAKSVLVTIVEQGELPQAWIDREKGRIHLFFASADHPDVVALTDDPSSCVCYLWSSADGRQSHAWLLKTG